MNDAARARQGLEKLLKLACADADALRVDLVDIERARASAESSLTRLTDAVRREERLTAEGAAAADFTAYLEGVRERRLNLQTTMMTLTTAEENARERLEAAHLEIKKLEHLIALNAEAARKNAIRRQRRASDATPRRRRAS